MAFATDTELLDTGAAARRLGISRREVQRLCAAGLLPFIGVGNRYKFTEPGLLTWLERQQGMHGATAPQLRAVSSDAPDRATVQEQIAYHLREIARLTLEL